MRISRLGRKDHDIDQVLSLLSQHIVPYTCNLPILRDQASRQGRLLRQRQRGGYDTTSTFEVLRLLRADYPSIDRYSTMSSP
jgi:hypothetical protein